MMGSPPSEACRFARHESLRQVTLTNGFEIQTTEVTQGQFKAVMGYQPSHFTSCGTDCPVEMVSWNEAVAYCNALSRRVGNKQCYSCTGSGKNVSCREAPGYAGRGIYTCPGYRLPTEAEWEYAHRAGTSTPYHSGENDRSRCNSCSSRDPNADRIGWYCANSGKTNHPVARKQANRWGLYDMAGNVEEPVHDSWQSNLGSSPVTDPATSGTTHATRGGNSLHPAWPLRAAFRNDRGPSTGRNQWIGIRCVRTRKR